MDLGKWTSELVQKPVFIQFPSNRDMTCDKCLRGTANELSYNLLEITLKLQLIQRKSFSK